MKNEELITHMLNFLKNEIKDAKGMLELADYLNDENSDNARLVHKSRLNLCGRIIDEIYKNIDK